MFFKKNELEALVANGVAEQEKLAALEGKFLALRPKWAGMQETCETLQSRFDSIDSTYSRDVPELFWKERREILQREIDAACLKRDALTAGLCAEITALKQKVFLRNSALAGDFGSWVAETVRKLGNDHPLAERLIAARAQCEGSQDIREIVNIITRTVTDVAEQPAAFISLFNLNSLARRLSEAA